MNEPDPYAALERVLKLHKSEQRNLLRLTVWCENEKCSPIRVFEIREGLLVQCRSDANVRDMQEDYPNLSDWSRRRAFFIQEWLDLGESSVGLQVVCDCKQTEPRLIDMRKVSRLIPQPGEKTRRNVPLVDLLP